MSYDNYCYAIFIAHIYNLTNDLCLCGHIQGTGRFICQQKPGTKSHRHSDTNPLPHSTGKFKGVTLHDIFRIGQAHVSQHSNSHPVGFFFRFFRSMCLNIINKLAANPPNRIDHISTILKNHGHFSATHTAPLIRGIFQHILPIINNAAAADAPCTGQTSHNRTNYCGFSTAAFPNN